MSDHDGLKYVMEKGMMPALTEALDEVDHQIRTIVDHVEKTEMERPLTEQEKNKIWKQIQQAIHDRKLFRNALKGAKVIQ